MRAHTANEHKSNNSVAGAKRCRGGKADEGKQGDSEMRHIARGMAHHGIGNGFEYAYLCERNKMLTRHTHTAAAITVKATARLWRVTPHKLYIHHNATQHSGTSASRAILITEPSRTTSNTHAQKMSVTA